MDTVAVVTGASGGIGSAVARRLSTVVDHMILSGRREAALASLRLPGPARVERVVADVTSEAAVGRLSAAVARANPGRLVLVNAAGAFGPIGSVGESDPEEWGRTLDVHVVGAVRTMTAMLPMMIASGWGRVVNVSSAQTLHGPDAAAGAYAAAKAALNVLTAGAAMQVDGTEVSVCALHPGDVDTAMAEDIRRGAAAAGEPARHLAEWGALIGAGNGDDPEGAGELVAEIISRPASWSNGRFLLVDSSRARHPREGWSMPVGPGPS